MGGALLSPCFITPPKCFRANLFGRSPGAHPVSQSNKSFYPVNSENAPCVHNQAGLPVKGCSNLPAFLTSRGFASGQAAC